MLTIVLSFKARLLGTFALHKLPSLMSPVYASLLAENQVLAILSPTQELPGGALPCSACP